MVSVYKASEWIPSSSFLCSHAWNRELNPEVHSHDFFEIVFLFTGTVYHQIGQNELEMQEGDVVILRPGESHILIRKSEELDLFSISVTEQEMRPFLIAYHVESAICDKSKYIRFSLDQRRRQIEQIFERLSRLTKTEFDEQIRIILGIAIHAFMNARNKNQQTWYEIILRQMNNTDNLREGVPAMQRLCNLSHAQLCRVVKKQTGKTPQQYVKELRLLRAYDLIESTDMSFEDIANTVGYYSFSHFSTSFKEHFHITPATLRKRNITML